VRLVDAPHTRSERRRLPRHRLIVIASIVFVVSLVGLIAAIETTMHSPIHTGIIRPQVTLSVLSVSSNDAVIVITNISSAAKPVNLIVNVRLTGSAGIAVPMPTVNNTTVRIVSNTTALVNFTVRWNDNDRDGLLTSGDTLTVSDSGGLPHPGVYSFYLFWVDGNLITSVDFRTQ
jgi:hypothetical protein